MTFKGTPVNKKKTTKLLTPSLTPIYPNKRLDWDKENYDPISHRFSPTYEQLLLEREIMRSSLSKLRLETTGPGSLTAISPSKEFESPIYKSIIDTAFSPSAPAPPLSPTFEAITHIYESTTSNASTELSTPSNTRISFENQCMNDVLTAFDSSRNDDSELRRLEESIIAPVINDDIEWSGISMLDRSEYNYQNTRKTESSYSMDQTSTILRSVQDPPPLEENPVHPTYKEAAQRRLRRGLR